jgi:hypothetical protein
LLIVLVTISLILKITVRAEPMVAIIRYFFNGVDFFTTTALLKQRFTKEINAVGLAVTRAVFRRVLPAFRDAKLIPAKLTFDSVLGTLESVSHAFLAAVLSFISTRGWDGKRMVAVFALKINWHDRNRKCPPFSTPEASPCW